MEKVTDCSKKVFDNLEEVVDNFDNNSGICNRYIAFIFNRTFLKTFDIFRNTLLDVETLSSVTVLQSIN